VTNYFDEQGWRIAEQIGSDGSMRSYTRVEKYGRSAIVMDARAEPAAQTEQFVKIAEFLEDNGLRAPKIYDRAGQVLLIEDFGGHTLRSVMPAQRGDDIMRVLESFARLTNLPPLPDFFHTPFYIGHRRVVDWYVPLACGESVTYELLKTYSTIWGELLDKMPPADPGFVHGDFHPDNLMALPDGAVGILDFQDACYGPLAYDWVNWLDDARADIPDDTRNAALSDKSEGFRHWYDFLALVFHSRITGQCLRWALNGKPRFLGLLPRMESKMRRHLQKPEFSELASFFADIGVDFSGLKDFNEDRIKELVREDAY